LVTSTPVTIDLQQNGGDTIALTANGTAQFPTAINNNTPYAVTISTQPANTDLQSQLCNVVSGSGTLPTHNITINVDCGTTCASIHAADPNAGDGLFLIDPDGTGPIQKFQAYCLMLFDGGGWTLAESTDNGNGPNSCSAGVVTQNSCTYMPIGTVEALADLSTQVHIRNPVSPGATPVDYIESVSGPDSLVIQNLRAGEILDANVPIGNDAADEALWPTFASNGANPGNEPDSAHIFDTNCNVSGFQWPNVYYGCNATTLSLIVPLSRWESSGTNVSLETYVR
jgi:hypothetical protein